MNFLISRENYTACLANCDGGSFWFSTKKRKEIQFFVLQPKKSKTFILSAFIFSSRIFLFFWQK